MVYFHETDYCIIYSYLERYFKIGVLKTLYTVHRKTTVSEFVFNETATFLIKESEIDAFLWILRNCQKHQFYKSTLRLLILYLWNICNYSIKFNVSYPKWLFQSFETLINLEMYTCEIKITWTLQIVLLRLLILYLWNICNYSIKFNVSYPKWLFQSFETLINLEMYTCEIKITWTLQIVLFLLFLFCKICY